MVTGPAARPPGPTSYQPTRPGRTWRASGWVTLGEWLLWLAWLVGTLGCLATSLWARVTFGSTHVAPTMLAQSHSWLLAAVWFAVGPSSASLLLALLARRRAGIAMAAVALTLGLVLALAV